MFTGDKAEVINPNRVHEGLKKGAFVCLSVYVTEKEREGQRPDPIFQLNSQYTHSEAILPRAASVIQSG